MNISGHLTADQIHIVPGNHDVDYLGGMRFVDLTSNRFQPLNSIVHDYGMGELTTELRITSLVDEAWSPVVHSVNSCLASGAPRSATRLEFLDALQDFLMTQAGLDANKFVDDFDKELRELGHEILDIPLIEPETLRRIVQSIRGNVANRLPVIVAHHGFLPQGTPRINPYTEMINGGQVREALLLLGCPVLYLHGHIHKNVEEKIEGGPEEAIGGGPILSVAAPCLVDGFNEIIVELTSGGVPLGITVRRYRVNRTDGSVRIQGPSSNFSLTKRKLQDERFRPISQFVIERTMVTGQSLVDEFESVFGLDELKDFMADRVWQGVFDLTPDSWARPFQDRNFVFK